MTTYYVTITDGSGDGYWQTYVYYPIVAQTPPTGYHFGFWSSSPNLYVTDAGSSSTTAFIWPSYSQWAAVYWILNSYTVYYNAGTGGHISGSSPQTINHGSNTSAVTAIPDSGYYFTQWDDANTNATRSDTITSNKTWTASFAVSNPGITSLSVTTGGPAGGTSTVIAGIRFTGTTSVKFGTTAASFSVDSDTQITATSPAHAIGIVDVSVTNATGTGTLTNAFTYEQQEQSAAGAVSPSGGIAKFATTTTVSGALSPAGSLSIMKTSAYAVATYSSIGITGNLFIYSPRPQTLYAPHVPTVLNIP